MDIGVRIYEHILQAGDTIYIPTGGAHAAQNEFVSRYIHTYRHTYIHTCLQMYVYIYIHTYTHTYIHTCLYRGV